MRLRETHSEVAFSRETERTRKDVVNEWLQAAWLGPISHTARASGPRRHMTPESRKLLAGVSPKENMSGLVEQEGQ